MTLPTAERIERDKLLAKGLKKCAHCRKALPVSAFSKRNDGRIGLKSWCRLCVRTWQREYYLAHLDKRRKQHQQYYRNHKAEKRAYRKVYRQAHREEIVARTAKYRQTEQGRAKQRQRKSKRRALKRGLPNTLTEAEWQLSLDFFGNRCAYCGVADVPLAQDHIVPVSAGGGYVMGNIIPVCQRCNSSKNNLPLDTWAKGRGLAFVRDDAVERVQAYLNVD